MNVDVHVFDQVRLVCDSLAKQIESEEKPHAVWYLYFASILPKAVMTCVKYSANSSSHACVQPQNAESMLINLSTVCAPMRV